jgi:hypothetical protein
MNEHAAVIPDNSLPVPLFHKSHYSFKLNSRNAIAPYVHLSAWWGACSADDAERIHATVQPRHGIDLASGGPRNSMEVLSASSWPLSDRIVMAQRIGEREAHNDTARVEEKINIVCDALKVTTGADEQTLRQALWHSAGATLAQSAPHALNAIWDGEKNVSSLDDYYSDGNSSSAFTRAREGLCHWAPLLRSSDDAWLPMIAAGAALGHQHAIIALQACVA